MRIKFFPYHIRRQCLRLYSDGWAYRKITAHTTISVTTFRGWAKEAGVEPNSKLSEEELDAKIEGWREKFAESDEMREKREKMTAKENERRLIKERKKFGLSSSERSEIEEKTRRSWAELKEAGADPDKWQEHIAATMERTSHELANATSPEAQVNALQASLALVSLQGVAVSPPPVTNWADVERVARLLRQALGMDKDDGNKDSDAADLRVLTARVEKGKVIEISDGKRGRKKKRG